MSIRQKVKENALGSLKHHWGRAISILLFLFTVSTLFVLLEQFFCYLLKLSRADAPALVVDLFHGSIVVSPSMAVVTLTFTVVSFLLVTPLLLGTTKWYWHQTGGEKPALLTIFNYFYDVKSLFRSILLRFLTGVRMLLWAALFSVPSVLIFWILMQIDGGTSSFQAIAEIGLLLLEGVVTAAMAVIWFFWIQRYFLVDYLFVTREEMSLHGIFRESVRIMKNSRLQVTGLYLSFLPWLLLGLLIFPLLFVLPYLFASTSIHARVLLERDEREREPSAPPSGGESV